MVAPANKQDSNNVGTYFAAETQVPGVLPGSPVWIGLEPNSFDDFGGENTLLSRKFITNTRQRTKGKITDLEAGGSLNIDLTQTNHQELIKGLMFAEFRDKGRSPITAIAPNSITVANGAAFAVGSIVKPLGVFDPLNVGPFKVTAKATNVLTVVGGATEAVTVVSILSEVGFEAAAGDIEIDVSGGYPAMLSTVLDFTTLQLNVGEFVFIGGDDASTAFDSEGDNGFKRIRSIAAHKIEFDKSDAEMVADDGAGKSIRVFFGRFIHNEKGSLIKRFPYQIMRELGAPDNDLPDEVQSEYLLGSFFNEGVFNMETADKINVDLTVLSMNNEYRTAAQGVKGGTRIEAPGEDAFNTSTDIPIWHLAIIEPGNEYPKPLFAYMTDVSFTLNNNMQVNKAIGVVGGFDVTAGTFEVDIETTAYMADIDACIAVKNNVDCTLWGAIVSNNAGIVIDWPLIGLGGGRLDVEVDQAIMLPITSAAATAKKISPDLDYTMSFGFFDYLPTMANPPSA